MCGFCTQHGDGRTWYLQASNYAADLARDLERRAYIIDFVRSFDHRIPAVVKALGAMRALPSPLRRRASDAFTRRVRPVHFGQPVPLEDCDRILDITTSVVRLPCVCRRFARTADEGWCLAITTRPVDALLAEAFKDYITGPDTLGLEPLDKPGALRLLGDAERRGLMHSVWTFLTPFIGAICNCNLASGCMAMRLTREFGVDIMWRGENVAAVDTARCDGCGACVERCPFDAIRRRERGGAVVVAVEDCFGCGVCRSACERGAITLLERRFVRAAAGIW